MGVKLIYEEEKKMVSSDYFCKEYHLNDATGDMH